MSTVIIWISLRILTGIIAGLVSTINPIAPIELRVPLFPPSAPISQWLERALISPWMRWDALWYERIVTQGYSATDGTAQFHPLYPWAATPLARAGILPGLSLLIISSIAGIALYYGFRKLAQLDLDPKDSTFAVILLAFAPPAFILFAPYAESLFLLAAILCIYFVRRKSWWLAGMMGGLAALTRQQGVLLVIPIAWEMWESAGRKAATFFKLWRAWIALAFIPLGLLIWLIYRAVILDDLHVSLHNLHDLIYSMAISPSATHVVPVQKFIWPWQALYNSLVKIATQPDVDIWVNIISAVFFLILLAAAWRKLRFSYKLYSLSITLISFSYYTGTVHPYMGLLRHLLLAFPLFIGLAQVIHRQWVRLLLMGTSMAGMFFLLVLFVLETWVP